MSRVPLLSRPWGGRNYPRCGAPVVHYLTFLAGTCAGAGALAAGAWALAAAADFGRHPETTFLTAL